MISADKNTEFYKLKYIEMKQETSNSEQNETLNIAVVSESNLRQMAIYPFKDGKNIIYKPTKKWYYYHELIKMGYSTMILSKIERIYSH